jgi:hypothetical protein
VCVGALLARRRLEKDSKVIKYFTVLDLTMSNSSNTESMRGKTGERKRSAGRQDNKKMPSEPQRKLRRSLQTADVNSSRRRVTTRRPLSELAAGQQRAEITDGRVYESA